jgi:uncharacterized membrane-anchored protein YitT (DUF2179 family)
MYYQLQPFHGSRYKTIENQITNSKTTIMNLKRIFGSLLTALGIAALIYAVLFTNTSGNNQDIKSLIIYAVLGSIFFTSGISLVRTTKDES